MATAKKAGPYVPPRERGKYTEVSDFLSMLGRMVKAAGLKVGRADAEDLAALVAIHRDLEDAIRAGVEGLRADGYSWRAIGEALGVSGQAVNMRYGKPKAG